MRSRDLITQALILAALAFGVNAGAPKEDPILLDPIPYAPQIIETTEEEPEMVSLGEFKLTAYCSCSKCCGVYGEDRPRDREGRPIVKTADGNIAEQGVTIAAPKDFPFGTELTIDGHTYTVQDRGGAIKDNHIDIYFDNHSDAQAFGVQYAEVYIKNK